MISVYIAGPDVFRSDAVMFFDRVKSYAFSLGLIALCPFGDGPAPSADAIFRDNVRLLKRSQAVIANVNAFRGSEPDSGTCWEIGYAAAMDLPVVMYMNDVRTTDVKANDYFQHLSCARISQTVMPDGMVTEQLGYPVNLMLAKSGLVIQGDVFHALARLREHIAGGDWVDGPN